MRLVFAIASWLLAFGPSQAAALTYEPLVLDDGSTVLVVEGEFAPSDDLKRFLSAIIDHTPDLVTFNSPGGSLGSALAHGRAIRRLGLSTFQLRRLECASACAFAFLGGIERFADPGSIGVHQSSFAADNDADMGTAVGEMQVVTADLLQYLREMGVDAELLELSLSTSPSDIRYLTAAEMQRMGVSTEDVSRGGVRKSAEKPAASPVHPPAARAIPEPAVDWRAASRDFVQGIIAAHTIPASAALDTVRLHYASTVDYYGATTTLPGVLQDKADYFDRWPTRFYAIRSGTLSVDCSASSCDVSGLYDWSVQSVQRNRQASGTASFEFGVDVSSGRMLIIRETSTVISR